MTKKSKTESSLHRNEIFISEKRDIIRGDTMQKWHIFGKNEKFSRQSDRF